VTKRAAGPDASDVLACGAIEEKPIWIGLFESLRDTLFPPKLPPLELTSVPIPIIDRMASKTNPWALSTSTLINGGILAIAILLGLKACPPFANRGATGHIDLSQWKQPILAKGIQSGGSGGSHELINPIQGQPPKIELQPITPPQAAVIENPKLAVEAAIAAPPDIRLPESLIIPNLGVAKSPNVTLPSNGPGAGDGVGWHEGGGDGPGNGPGAGLGSEQGVFIPGRGGVTAPVPLVTPEAEFSDEARREKYQGICLVGLIVDARGNPQNVHVVQHLGMGLDEKAVEAIRKYRFKPAMKNGKPVAAAITVEVDFRLF
jgi:periplasmic protein TonB